jgi:EAL domain-containing protein (putative c-di-GMP-specific phosphodiesterase class I)
MIASSIHDEISTTVGWFMQGQVPPDGHQARIAIPNGRFQIGRRSDVNCRLSDSSVSKLHAEFIASDFSLFIRDLGSTNGTYVNGIRIHETVPIDECDIVQFAAFEFVVGRMCVDQSSARTQVHSVSDWMQTLTQFHKLLTEKALVPHFQPVVQLSDGHAVGYEILARSRVPGMVSAREMFDAAERTNQAERLSVMCRQTGIEVAQRLAPTATMFVNTHPCESAETGLLNSLAALRAAAPTQPIILELHEAALTNPSEMRAFRSHLQDMQIGLAYDDFGAGQSRLQDLAEVAPDFLKFDMSLIRDIHLLTQRQQIVAGLVRLALDLGIQPLAEGIENSSEAEVCTQIGFTHAQGYYYGKPTPEVSMNYRSDSTIKMRSIP